MQKYVPASYSAATNRLKTCVLSGVQLTTEWIHNLQKICATSESQSARFDGFLPIHAHWHAEVTYLQVRNVSIYVLILYKIRSISKRHISMYTTFCFACSLSACMHALYYRTATCTMYIFSFLCLQAMMDHLYASGSSMDGGTLMQLRNLINRQKVSKDVTGCFNATVDYMQSVIDCHIVAAAMNYFGISKTTDNPSLNYGLDILAESTDATEKWRRLQTLVGDIVDRYIFIQEFVNIGYPGHAFQ